MRLIGMQREQVYSYNKDNNTETKKAGLTKKTRLQQHVTSAKAMRDGHVAMLDIQHPLLPPAFGQLAAAKQLHAHRP